MTEPGRPFKRPREDGGVRLPGASSEVSLEGRTLDFRGLFQTLLTHGGYARESVERVPASKLTADWLAKSGLRKPVRVRASEKSISDLGMRVPVEKLCSMDAIAESLGPDVQVPTLDVATQSPGPVMSMRQWHWYWRARQSLMKGRVVSVSDPQKGRRSKPLAVEIEDEADSTDVRKLLGGGGRPSAAGAVGGQESAATSVGLPGDVRYRSYLIPGLQLAGTALEGQVVGPAAVREGDLWARVTPPVAVAAAAARTSIPAQQQNPAQQPNQQQNQQQQQAPSPLHGLEPSSSEATPSPGQQQPGGHQQLMPPPSPSPPPLHHLNLQPHQPAAPNQPQQTAALNQPQQQQHSHQQQQQQQVSLQVAPAASYQDFTLAPAGAASWQAVVAGRKVVALAPPSPSNLATWAAWGGGARAGARPVFLGTVLKGMMKVQVCAGDVLLVPGGWLVASATAEDTVCLEGRFLHPSGLALHAELAAAEDGAVPVAGGFPGLEAAMWQAASFYTSRLRGLAQERGLLDNTQGAGSASVEGEAESQPGAEQSVGGGDGGRDGGGNVAAAAVGGEREHRGGAAVSSVLKVRLPGARVAAAAAAAAAAGGMPPPACGPAAQPPLRPAGPTGPPPRQRNGFGGSHALLPPSPQPQQWQRVGSLEEGAAMPRPPGPPSSSQEAGLGPGAAATAAAAAAAAAAGVGHGQPAPRPKDSRVSLASDASDLSEISSGKASLRLRVGGRDVLIGRGVKLKLSSTGGGGSAPPPSQPLHQQPNVGNSAAGAAAPDSLRQSQPQTVAADSAQPGQQQQGDVLAATPGSAPAAAAPDALQQQQQQQVHAPAAPPLSKGVRIKVGGRVLEPQHQQQPVAAAPPGAMPSSAAIPQVDGAADGAHAAGAAPVRNGAADGADAAAADAPVRSHHVPGALQRGPPWPLLHLASIRTPGTVHEAFPPWTPLRSCTILPRVEHRLEAAGGCAAAPAGPVLLPQVDGSYDSTVGGSGAAAGDARGRTGRAAGGAGGRGYTPVAGVSEESGGGVVAMATASGGAAAAEGDASMQGVEEEGDEGGQQSSGLREEGAGSGCAGGGLGSTDACAEDGGARAGDNRDNGSGGGRQRRHDLDDAAAQESCLEDRSGAGPGGPPPHATGGGGAAAGGGPPPRGGSPPTGDEGDDTGGAGGSATRPGEEEEQANGSGAAGGGGGSAEEQQASEREEERRRRRQRELTECELEGLPFLLALLRGWTRRPGWEAAVPPGVDQPKALLREMAHLMSLLGLPTSPELGSGVLQGGPGGDSLVSLEMGSMATGGGAFGGGGAGEEAVGMEEEAGESCLEASMQEAAAKGKRKATDTPAPADSNRKKAKQTTVRDRLKKKLGLR